MTRTTTTTKSYRDSTQIKISILKVISETEARRKHDNTSQYRSISFIIFKKLKLAYHQIRMHLCELYTDGLIDKYKPIIKNRGKKHPIKYWSYHLTNKGKRFLDKYQELINLVLFKKV